MSTPLPSRPPTTTFADASTRPVSEVLTPGATLGRYVVEGLLGRGGMGSVYAGFDPALGRPVALKVLAAGHAAPDARDRLLREARALAHLDDPHVIEVYDVGEVGSSEQIFLAMELVDGIDLHRWLARVPRSKHEILGIFLQAGRGLAAAHAAGLVHRDVKPSNIMVRPDGRVLMVDFGLARTASSLPTHTANETSPAVADREVLSLDALARGGDLTRPGAAPGTPRYMSPEQRRGEARVASDQFSFCVTLYEALLGEIPQTRGLGEDTPSAARLPRRLHRLLARGLAEDPSARYPSMDALLHDLERATRPASSRLTRVAVILALGILLSIAFFRDNAPRPAPDRDPATAPVSIPAPTPAPTDSQRRLDRMRQLLEEAPAEGGERPESSLLRLADVQHLLGDNDSALALNREALAVAEEAYGSEDPRLVSPLNAVGITLSQLGRPHEALDVYSRAFEIIRQLEAPPLMLRVSTAFNLGKALVRLERADDALPHLETALEIARDPEAGILEMRPHMLTALGEAHLERGEIERAVELLEEAQLLWRGAGQPAFHVAESEVVLARALARLGDPRAVELARRAAEVIAGEPDGPEKRRRLVQAERILRAL